jgi:signal transduction histidine kinase
MIEAARVRSPAQLNLRIVDDRLLPEGVTTQLQRIAQESLNNSIKHAEAKTIKVDLLGDADEIVLRITDDGCGFDLESPSVGHHGLGIMRERAAEIGAVVDVRSAIGDGTEVTVIWT